MAAGYRGTKKKREREREGKKTAARGVCARLFSYNNCPACRCELSKIVGRTTMNHPSTVGSRCRARGFIVRQRRPLFHHRDIVPLPVSPPPPVPCCRAVKTGPIGTRYIRKAIYRQFSLGNLDSTSTAWLRTNDSRAAP